MIKESPCFCGATFLINNRGKNINYQEKDEKRTFADGRVPRRKGSGATAEVARRRPIAERQNNR